MGQSYWMVMSIQKDIKISNFLFGERKLDLVWSDGMVGAVPVFQTEEDAKRYASGNGARIMLVTQVED